MSDSVPKDKEKVSVWICPACGWSSPATEPKKALGETLDTIEMLLGCRMPPEMIKNHAHNLLRQHGRSPNV